MAGYKKVLIIDDNQVDLYVGERVIRKFDFADEVIVVESATEGLNYLESCAGHLEAVPDIIFLDINMPELSGFDFLERYAELPGAVKHKCIIMMLTTSLNGEDQQRAAANPYVNHFLNKPLNEEKLTHVREHLQQ